MTSATDQRACVDWAGLAADLEKARARQRLTLRKVADQIGMPHSAVAKLLHGGKLSADSVARVVTWLYPHEVPAWIVAEPGSPAVSTADAETQTGQENPQ